MAGKCIEGEIIKSIRKKRVQAISLDETFSEDSTQRIEIANDINVETEVVLNVDLKNALTKLSELELFIIKHSFGIDTGICLTQSQIGKMVNLSQMHIGRLKRGALKKLREELEGAYS
ncbi:sigma-70 family RNA polymerase sigma factor [Lysinibacillus sp. BSL11]